MSKPLATDIDRRIGTRLQKLRQQVKVSAAALAEAIGSTQQQVSRYENGQNKIAASQLFRISRYLGVPISYFFQDVDEQTPLSDTPLSIKERQPLYQQAKIKEDLKILEAAWPRLNEAQRTSILKLFDTFLS